MSLIQFFCKYSAVISEADLATSEDAPALALAAELRHLGPDRAGDEFVVSRATVERAGQAVGLPVRAVEDQYLRRDIPSVERTCNSRDFARAPEKLSPTLILSRGAASTVFGENNT